MRICDVIGKVTLNRCHPSLRGARWLIGVPLSSDGLQDDSSGRGEPFVIFDELSAGTGSLVAVSEGAEASAPFHPDSKPLDAYVAALLDAVQLDPSSSK